MSATFLLTALKLLSKLDSLFHVLQIPKKTCLKETHTQRDNIQKTENQSKYHKYVSAVVENVVDGRVVCRPFETEQLSGKHLSSSFSQTYICINLYEC